MMKQIVEKQLKKEVGLYNIKKKNVSIILVILWMALIFTMSSFDGTNSSNQSNFIVDILASLFSIKDTSFLSLIIRKSAHFTEYFILGLFLSNMFKYLNKNNYLSIVITILYAFSDEIHQNFVPGRCMAFSDVLIDSIGGTIAIIMYNLISKYMKNKKIKE